MIQFSLARALTCWAGPMGVGWARLERLTETSCRSINFSPFSIISFQNLVPACEFWEGVYERKVDGEWKK